MWIDFDRGACYTPPMARQLRLRTRDAARQSLARIIRDFDRDPNADVARFKATVHAMSALLAYDRVADELALDERLNALEAAVARQS